MKKGFMLVELLIVVAILGILVAVAVEGVKNHGKRDAFMRECGQDKKQYECETMWATANPQPQVVHIYSH